MKKLFIFVQTNLIIMSHGITLISKETEEEISYLSIEAFDTVKCSLLYSSLDSEDYNKGVSGSGESKEFSREELKTAVAKLGYLADEPSSSLQDGKTEIRNSFLGIFGQDMSDVNQEKVVICVEQIALFINKALDTDGNNFIIDFL